MSRPLQISPETAIKLSKELNIPLEQLMHMPQHILLQKLAQLSAGDDNAAKQEEDRTSGSKEEQS
ncbi:YycC family protein [Paenibacillus sp. GCM10027626]|uniref:YycC family protein n=1 Tax=Paenibacillus sp. GCM10027626 TaxID=3273411 RepID=UPI003628055E